MLYLSTAYSIFQYNELVQAREALQRGRRGRGAAGARALPRPLRRAAPAARAAAAAAAQVRLTAYLGNMHMTPN